MTQSEREEYRALVRDHQTLLRDWKRNKGPCIICAEREGDEGDHLPPKVLLPASLRNQETPMFTFPVCSKCNRGSSDDDFLLSVALAFGLNQESIRKGLEPSDPDLLALYRQAQRQFDDPRARTVLKPYIEIEPRSAQPSINLKRLPVYRTLIKIAKSYYWMKTRGDILQRYNPGWWIRDHIDTSKPKFIEHHLKTTYSEIHWGDRFICRFNIGHATDGVGGYMQCSFHFYTHRQLGEGMNWLLVASPKGTQLNGVPLYELSKAVWGSAQIEPE